MKKLFIISSIILASCGRMIPIGTILENQPYIVQSIDWYASTHCRYNLSTNEENLSFKDNLTIVDSIGKFKIGDTLRFSLYK